MFETHPHFDFPAESTAIWRYMDFTKFVSLLLNRKLFFARGDKFEDPYEGAWSVPSQRALENEYQDWLKDRDPREIAEILKEHKGFSDILKWTVAINCWHISEHESAVMWRLYLKSNEGIAIRSTVGKLRDSLEANDQRLALHIGRVRYIDYATEAIPTVPPKENLVAPFIYKRKSFEHERELRALVMSREIPITAETNQYFRRQALPSDGIAVPVRLEQLIEKIFVAPTSPQWYYDLVVSISAQYDFGNHVTRSDLDRAPIW